MNKTFKLGFVILITIALLAACGTSESEETTSGSSGGENEEDVTTLGFYTWIKDDTGNWDAVIEAFEEEHPGIKIDKQILVDNASHEDYLKQLDLIASSGDQIDVMMFANPIDFAKRVESGLVAPLNEFIEEEGLNVEEEYASPYTPIDGTYYGLPAKQVANLVLLNKEHLDEAGLEIPAEWTWDDYADYAEKLTTGEGTDKHYGSFFFTWPDTFYFLKMLSKSENLEIINSDGTSNADDPMLEASLAFRYEMEQERQVSTPLADTLSTDLNYRQQFFSQDVSMIPSGSFLITQWGGFEPDFEIAWAPWPKNNEEDPVTTKVGGDVVAVGESSDQKEAAYTFARWLTTEGMIVQERFIPSWNHADASEVLDNLIAGTSNPDAIHKESLQHTLEIGEPVVDEVPVPYISEAYDVLNTEAELYLLGQQDLETTMENVKKKVDEVIENNQ